MDIRLLKDRIGAIIGMSSGTRLTGRSDKGAVDYSRYRLTPGDMLREGAKGAALAALISFSFYRSMSLFIVLGPILTVAVPLSMRPRLREQRQWELTLQFREAIWLMSGFMNAGLSPDNALQKTVPELYRLYGERSMIYKEFHRIELGMAVNIPVERMFIDFGQRSGVQDIRNFAEVFALVKRSGGNMRETVEKTTDIIRDKVALMDEIKLMTAGRRYEQNIMNIIPFAIILYINVTTGSFLESMYESPAGRIVMTLALMLLGVSYILSRKILDIRM